MCGWILVTDGEKVPVTNQHYFFRAVLVLAGALLVSAYAIAISAPAAGLFHDDGIYLVTARALAEGRGYSIISLPESPSQTKYPILFPWLLSLVWRLAPSFPDNLLFLRIIPLASTVSLALAVVAIASQVPGTSGFSGHSVVTLTAASPWVLFLSTALLSETLFAALLTGSLLVLTQVREGLAAQSAGFVLSQASGGGLLSYTHSRDSRCLSRLRMATGHPTPSWCDGFRGGRGGLRQPWASWVLLNAGADAESYYSASNYASWNVVFHYAWPETFTVIAMNALQAVPAPLAMWSLDTTFG